MNKKILIGAGILAAAGLTYYLWKKNKASETETKTGGETKPEVKVNALGRVGSRMSLAPLILNATVGNCSTEQLAGSPPKYRNCIYKGAAGCCAEPIIVLPPKISDFYGGGINNKSTSQLVPVGGSYQFSNAMGRLGSRGKINTDCPTGCSCDGGKVNCFINQLK